MLACSFFLCMQWLHRRRARGCRCTVRSAPARRPPSPSLLEMLRWDQVRTDYYVRRKASRGAEDVLNPAKLHVLMTQVDFGTSSTFGIGSGFGSSAWIDADGDPTIVPSESRPWPSTRPWTYHGSSASPAPAPSASRSGSPCTTPAHRAPWRLPRLPLPRLLWQRLLQASNTSANADCRYQIEYSDDRAAAGTYMPDTLTISGSTTVHNIRFGCSHAVRRKFSDLTAGTWPRRPRPVAPRPDGPLPGERLLLLPTAGQRLSGFL